MKHKISITLILLGMFLVTQLIGMFVVNTYAPIEQTIINPATRESEIIMTENVLPFGLQVSEDDPTPNFISIVFCFVLAFALISVLMKYKWKIVIRLWFFLVTTLALAISINAFLSYSSLANIIDISIIALIISALLAVFKIFKSNKYIHNFTELLIYPGIAAIFVSILTPVSVIALLVLISFYDMWAVWKSGIMQKMAKFQMEELKIFGGFLIPSTSKKVKSQIEKIKQKYKGKKIPASIKKKKFKVSLAILGGGDIIFPIITSGVFMRAYGIIPALLIMAGAFAGLVFLFTITKKGKSYPAMPYISVGIFLGMLIWRVFIF